MDESQLPLSCRLPGLRELLTRSIQMDCSGGMGITARDLKNEEALLLLQMKQKSESWYTRLGTE